MHVNFTPPRPPSCMEAMIIVILLVTIGGSILALGIQHVAADPNIGPALRAALH